MFFTISKILDLFLSPFIWMGICLLLAFFTKRPKRRKLFLGLSCLIFVVFGNMFVADELMRLWERPVTRYDQITGSYDVGIVLGGGMVQEDKKNNRLIFRHNTDRLLQAIELYKNGIIKKILLSSGSGDLYLRDMKEGALLKKYLVNIGIPQTDILVDSVSDNTYENALMSEILLKKYAPGGRYLLITSSFHMRRAMACFKKQGLACDPFATSKGTGPRVFTIQHLLIPNMGGMIFYHRLLHESIGLLVYKIMGYA